jgi:RNA polymerase sigma-70 factor, ECF subfamily
MQKVSAMDDNPGAAIDEKDMIRAAQADPTAFDMLYHRYADQVYAYLRTQTSTPDDAADLTQQVFLQALRALPRYHLTQVPFAAWLFRIARNAVTNHHQRHRRTIPWVGIPEAVQPVATCDPEAEALHRDALARVRLLFEELDAETRELLALRFAAGLTAGEIAAVVGKSEAATRKKLTRTIQILKERYDDETR